MWIDERGSEVLGLGECHRLLALGAKEGRHGHLGLPSPAAPIVLPLDYAIDGHDVVVRVGEGLFSQLDGTLVAFQVDGGGDPIGAGDSEGDLDAPWSVLVRGLALGQDVAPTGAGVPRPRVAEPGRRFVRIRSDAITGRRLGAPASAAHEPESPSPQGSP